MTTGKDDPGDLQLVLAGPDEGEDAHHGPDEHAHHGPWWRHIADHKHEHLFDPHDSRETSARFRYPCQRNVWVDRPDGTRVNSADTEKRGMPPYLLVMDLVFAALSGLCARAIDLYGLAGVPRFFLLFFSVSWSWVLVTNRFNCFDPEDVSFELFMVLVMVLKTSIALSLSGCFLADEPPYFQPPPMDTACQNASLAQLSAHAQLCAGALPGGVAATTSAAPSCAALLSGANLSAGCALEAEERSWKANMQTQSMWIDGGSVCFDFVLSQGLLRLLLLVLHCYIAYHVQAARRPVLRRDASVVALWLAMVVATPWIVGDAEAATLSSMYRLEGLLCALSIFDVVWCAGSLLDNGALPQPLRGACEAGRCVGAKISSIPISIPYAESRYERIVVIGIGNIVATSVSKSVAAGGDLGPGSAWAVCFGVPWISFVLKIFYFDLSDHHAANNKMHHALRRSRFTGASWSHLHMPLFGSILWISRAMGNLIEAEGGHSTADFDPEQPCELRTVASFCASLLLFLLLCTAVQSLHKGHGHGHRRLGRTRRMMLRFSMMLLLVALAALAVAYRIRNMTYFWASLTILTAEAAVELWGRNFTMSHEQMHADGIAHSHHRGHHRDHHAHDGAGAGGGGGSGGDGAGGDEGRDGHEHGDSNGHAERVPPSKGVPAVRQTTGGIGRTALGDDHNGDGSQLRATTGALGSIVGEDDRAELIGSVGACGSRIDKLAQFSVRPTL